MSESENDMQNVSQADEAGNSRELHRTVNLLFAGLIITSLTLTAYLGLEAKRAGTLASGANAQAERVEQEFKQTEANVHTAFEKLQEFARTHPDFQAKVLSKYTMTTNSSAGATK
jgi:hypothetical protein